jgi:hypothetical protein
MMISALKEHSRKNTLQTENSETSFSKNPRFRKNGFLGLTFFSALF